MRVFLACLPPPALRARLAQRQHALQARVGGRATPAAQLHLTLAFLGELSPLQLYWAADCAERASRIAPLRLRLCRCGSWPPGTVWIAPGQHALAAWAGALRRDLAAHGLAQERRPFQPHLTLLRRARQTLEEEAAPALVWRVESLSLLASALLPQGACHTVLEHWPLAAPSLLDPPIF